MPAGQPMGAAGAVQEGMGFTLDCYSLKTIVPKYTEDSPQKKYTEDSFNNLERGPTFFIKTLMKKKLITI
jgi:hypothetical protein